MTQKCLGIWNMYARIIGNFSQNQKKYYTPYIHTTMENRKLQIYGKLLSVNCHNRLTSSPNFPRFVIPSARDALRLTQGPEVSTMLNVGNGWEWNDWIVSSYSYSC